MEKGEVWKILEEIIRHVGLQLFDVDLPGAGGGVLRVYISSEDHSKGIGHDECLAVSRRILDHEKVEELMPGKTTLEVSSPGINRRLSRAEHLRGAVGERVRLTFITPTDRKKRSITGELRAFDGSTLEIDAEGEKGLHVPFSDFVEARVDFLFK